MPSPQIIIGIDPGTRNVGYGVIEASGSSFKSVAHGCIHSKGDEISLRLVTIHQELQKVIRKYSPSVAAIETVFAGENIKTAIAIGEARGVAIISAAELGLEVFGYEPALVKRAVAGNGRAGKEQIQQMIKVLLNLPEIPPTDHEADALALAITHVNRARFAGISGVTIPSKKRRRKKY
jgi:crossover junction endodeoxyribonuclease RuvC